MKKEERFSLAYHLILNAKGKKTLTQTELYEIWKIIFPETLNIINNYAPTLKSGNRLYDNDDLIVESYFAFLEAFNRAKFDRGSMKEFYEFFGLYKCCVRSQTAKTRAVYKENDPVKVALSLDQPIDAANDILDNDSNLGEISADPQAENKIKQIIQNEYLTQLKSALNALEKYLTENERIVIKAFYYKGLKTEQIAAELKLSKASVLQLEKRALFKYRSHAEEVSLRSFLAT